MADILMNNFPDWPWAIEPDQNGGIINVFNLALHDQWGFTIRTEEIQNDPKRRLAYRAGREILELFGLEARGRKRQENALMALKRDRNGQAVPPAGNAWGYMTKQQREQQRIKEVADRIRADLEKDAISLLEI